MSETQTRTSMTQSTSFAYRIGTSYLSPLETFCQYHLISSASTWKPHHLSVKTLTWVVSTSDLSDAISMSDYNYNGDPLHPIV